MEQLSNMLRRSMLLLCALGLGGCGYASSPGMVVETKKFPLSEKATLTVTRHLDDWRTGSLFRFEWYVVKCRRSAVDEAILMQDFVLRGTFSSEISEERIQIKDSRIGYAYFSELVVFDQNCNQLSQFNPWRTSMIDTSKITNPLRIESVHIGSSGRGYATLSWALKVGGVGGLELKTDDYGAHWIMPATTLDAEESVRVALPSSVSFTNYKKLTESLETSEYVVTGGGLTRRPMELWATRLRLAMKMNSKFSKMRLKSQRRKSLLEIGLE